MSARDTNDGRRGFLKNVLVGGGAAMVAVASGKTVAATAKPAAAKTATASQGYHVTPHILEYYKTAQF